MQLRGDRIGIEAWQRLETTREDDLADILAAARAYGRAFLREELTGSYRIWEIRPAGAASHEQTEINFSEAKFEIRPFMEGQILSSADEG